MEPINFKQSNLVLTAPKAMPNCEDLPVYADGKQCVSCWKMSWKERIKALFTGRVYLGVVGGRTQPPVWITSEKPFYEPTLLDSLCAFFRLQWDFIKSIKDAIKSDAESTFFYRLGLLYSLIFCGSSWLAVQGKVSDLVMIFAFFIFLFTIIRYGGKIIKSDRDKCTKIGEVIMMTLGSMTASVIIKAIDLIFG